MAQTWTLLSLIQEFCRRQNLPVPLSVVSATDELPTQLWGLLNEGVMALQTRGDWPQLDRQFLFSHVNGPGWLALNLYSPLAANVNQASLGAPGVSASIKYPTRATIFNRTNGMEVCGPLSDQDWSAMIATGGVESSHVWRMNGEGICIYPVPNPVAGTQFQLDCTIRETVADIGMATYKQVFSLDNDVCLLPADVVLADLRWRWRSEKGLSYAEHFRVAEDLIFDILGKGSGAGIVILDNDPAWPQVIRPGLLIPAGNWDVHN